MSALDALLTGEPAAAPAKASSLEALLAQGESAPAAKSATPTREPSRAGRAARSIVAGAADLADLGTVGLPAMMVSTAADIANRVKGLVDSRSRDQVVGDSEYITRTIQEAAGTPIRTLLTNLGAIDKTDETAIGQVMNSFSEALDKAGASIEESTAGKVKKQDFLSVTNATMASLGGLGYGAGVRAYGRRADAKAQAAMQADFGTKMAAEAEVRLAEADAAKAADEAAQAGPRQAAADLEARATQAQVRRVMKPFPRPPQTESFAPELETLRAKAESARSVTGIVPEQTSQQIAAFELAQIEAQRKARQALPPKALTAAVVGATGLGLAMAYEPDAGEAALAIGAGALIAGKGRGLTLEALRTVPDATPLGRLLDQSAYSLSTLEMLPKNRFEFTKGSVEQLLKRAEVTKAERDVLQGVLAAAPGETITAKQLMQGVKERTGDFELKAKQVSDFADYGLSNIDRAERNMVGEGAWIPEGATPEEAARLTAEAKAKYDASPVPTTTIWQSPLTLGDANHFGDPNYFAHTRSFQEGGVKHVVEIQSDYAQKASKPLTPEERLALEGNLTAVQTEINAALAQNRAVNLGTVEPGTTRVLLQPLRVREAELRSKLLGGPAADAAAPMLKNWHKRLIREELAASADQPVVRFATADTVAKVEGWPRQNDAAVRSARESVEAAERNLSDMEARLATRSGFTPAEQAEARQWLPVIREDLKRANEAYATAKADQTPRFSPEHQGIYDRYAGDITKFLKQLGGREITDSAGHTWIEVPTAGTAKMPAGGRVLQFGNADPRLLAYVTGVLGTAAVTAFLTDPPTDPDKPNRKVSNAILAGSLAALAGLIVLSKSGHSAVAEKATSTLRSVEDYLGNTSYQIEKISPPIERQVRNYLRLKVTARHDRLQAVAPFIEGLRHISSAGGDALSGAVLTGDWPTVIRTAGTLGKPELIPALAKVRQVLADTGAELLKFGLLKGLVDNYYPRIVHDLPGLLKAIGVPARDFLEKRLAEAEAKAKPFGGLDELGRAAVLNKALQESLFSKRADGANFRLNRSIDAVTQDLAKFYLPPAESLALYLYGATNAIEKARFFGKDAQIDPATGQIDLSTSAGNRMLAEKQAGRIDEEGRVELTRLLTSEFVNADRTADTTFRTMEQLTTAALLGNVGSAVMNLGDIAGSTTLLHGIIPTIKSLQQTITRKPTRITNADLGLANIIGEEFVGASRNPIIVKVPGVGDVHLSTAKFLDTVMTLSMFKALDAFTKEVHSNAGQIRAQRQLSTAAGVAKFTRDNLAYYGDDLPQLIAELRSGQKTPLVLEHAWKNVSEAQPISSLEMSFARTANPNWRFVWQMKNWMIKQMTLLRQKGVDQIRNGNTAAGTTFLLKYVLLAGTAGATMSWLINSLFWGREKELSWGDIPANALKNFGASQYAIDLVKQGQLGKAVASFAAPPLMVLTDIMSGQPKAVSHVPIVGKFIYNHAMGGAEKANEKERRKAEREAEGVR